MYNFFLENVHQTNKELHHEMGRHIVQKIMCNIKEVNDEKSQEDSCVQAWKATSLDSRKMETIQMRGSWGKNKIC